MRIFHNRKLYTVAFLILLVTMVWGIVELFSLRFSEGDVYPQYSSYRADPIGCKALYESLREISGLDVERHLRPVRDFQETAGSVFFYTGITSSSLVKDDRELFNYVFNGGSLVVIYSPNALPDYLHLQREREDKKDPKNQKTAKDKDKPEKKPDSDQKGKNKTDALIKYEKELKELRQRWDFELSKWDHNPVMPQEAVPTKFAEAVTNIPIYSQRYLKVDPGKWQVLYQFKKKPVMVERQLGKGKVILSSAAYFASNEGLFKSPRPELLSRLVGTATKVRFNEYLHGVAEKRTILWLGKRYHLEIMALNLLLLALLIVWRCLFELSVKGADKISTSPNIQVDSQYSSTGGLKNLLTMAVARSELLETCFKEWRKSAGYRLPDRQKITRMEECLANKELIDNKEKYNHIHQIVTERTRWKHNEKP